MKSSQADRRGLSIGLLVALYVCFVISLFASTSALPARVATHFGIDGTPDGWMSRSEHLTFMAAFGFLFPLLMVAVCWSIRFLPTCMVNIPNRLYWLSGERRAASIDYLMRHSYWLACLVLGLVIGMHWMVVISNQMQPVHLPMTWGIPFLVAFLGGIAIWMYCLYRRFRSPTNAGAND